MNSKLALAWLILGLVWGIVALPQAASLSGYQGHWQGHHGKTLKKVGESRLAWLIWDIYDAVLYSPTGTYAPHPPYVLELTYLRALDGAQVAAKTRQELKRLGVNDDAKLTQWQTQLTAWFQGIKPGTRLAAIRQTHAATTFVRDDRILLGTITDPLFTKAFFEIWLGERSLRPDLRRQLLGQTKEVAGP
jgi:hypothetical protein